MLFIDIQSIDESESLPSTVTVFLTSNTLITVSKQSLVTEVLDNYEAEISSKAGGILHMIQIINRHYLLFTRTA